MIENHKTSQKTAKNNLNNALSKLARLTTQWQTLTFEQLNIFWKTLETYNERQLKINDYDTDYNIITVLLHPTFHNLKKLSLQNCNIYTIQQFPQIQCAGIKQLNLNRNFISCLNPLKKFYYSDLQILQLQGNYIEEIKFMESAVFDKKLSKFYIDLHDGFNISWLAKMKVIAIEELWFQNIGWKGDQVMKIIKKKYIKMHMPLLKIYQMF